VNNTVSSALLVVARKECTHAVGLHTRAEVVDVNIRPEKKDKAAVPQDKMFTWRPEDSVLFTVIKTDQNQNQTVLHCHANGRQYYASQVAQLPQGVPVNTALLAQYVEDRSDASKTSFTPR
jgi:hypothetical protein